MGISIRHAFDCQPDGSWVCVLPIEWETPAGRIQVLLGTRFCRGTLFMGIDVVKLLEEEQRGRQGVPTYAQVARLMANSRTLP